MIVRENECIYRYGVAAAIARGERMPTEPMIAVAPAPRGRQCLALGGTPVAERSRPPVRCVAQISTSRSRSNLRRALMIALCSVLMRFFASGWRRHQAAL